MTLTGTKQYILHGFSVSRNEENTNFVIELQANNLRIQVLITGTFINLILTPPDDFHSNVDGLLGHFDGDSANDFTVKGYNFFFCSDIRYESNGIFVLGVVFFFRQISTF